MNTSQVLSELQFLDKYSRFDYQKGRRENWQETVTRVTDFLLSYLPEKERLTVGELIFNSILNKEVSPSMRLMATAGEAARLNEASIFNCFGRETEFVSEFGTVSFFDFNDGDTVRVKTHDGTWKNAVVKNFGKQKLNKITFARTRSTKEIRATSNHTWLLKNGERTQSLKPKDIIFGLPDEITDWNFDNASPIEKIAWCYGYVFGDGSVSNKHSMVRLCGEQNKFLDRFLSCGFGSTTSMSLVGDNIVFTGKYLKTTPELSVENLEEIRAFVIGYLDADAAKTNCHGRKKFVSIQSSQDDHIDFIESAFEMVGVYLLNTRDLTGQETNFGIRPNTKHFGLTNRITKTNSLWSVKEIVEDVVDDVWCLVVDDNHSFVLSGGIVTGNCSYLPLESTQDFHDLTLLLGLGVGVGFSVENHFVGSLGLVKEQHRERTVKFVVPDSIYGWAQSIKYLIENKMAGNRVHFDYSLIRPAGSPLKTRGGRACLTGDTIVYKDRKKSKEQNELTLDYLFWLKNNKPENFSKIKIRSLDEETGVFYRNKLVDIIYNGVAPVYLVETENGYKIKATNNHRFMDDTGRYKSLSMFSVNERIAVNGKDFGSFCIDCGATISRRSKRCRDCDRKSRLKNDALETTCRQRKEVRSYRNENNFCELCNSNLRLEVHHIDKNPRNNHVSNLQVLCSKCHHKIHLIDILFGNPYKQKFVSYDRITSIKFVGYEKVYDLQMMSPNHNFVANGFVSHNSGPEPLMDAHIAIGRILDERAGKEIRSIDAFDIACHIAGAIVSGGVRRCLPSGSLVHTKNGLIPIEKINVWDEVLTSNGYYPVLRKFFQGKQKVIKVVTEESFFECTGNHKIYVKEEDVRYVWKEAKNLKKGDKLHGLGMKEVLFLRLEDVVEEKITWDLEIDTKHEFFCEGYLMHNSAMITIFDIDDDLMLNAKSGDNFSKNLQRQYANISAVIDEEISEEEMSALIQRMHDSGFGEPGIFSRYAARQTMPERRKAVFGMGGNPCMEIILRPRQFCNLSQAIVRPEDTFDILKRKVEIATIIGTIQSSMNYFPELHPDFAKNNAEERLLGVSLSGIMDNKILQDAKVLSKLQEVVVKTNKKWAKILGINASVASTCVKPDGNTSLLYNTSPGLHPRWSPYYIRRVRLQYNNPVAQWLMDAGLFCEPVLGETWENVRTVVFDFPIKSPESNMYQMTATAIDQLETWRLLKIHWTEHNPSVTIHYKPSELDSIKQFCYLNQDILSGVSFLENGHKYVQAPYEEIDEQTYLDSLDRFPEVDYTSFWNYETSFDSTSGTQTLACVGGSCLI